MSGFILAVGITIAVAGGVLAVFWRYRERQTRIHIGNTAAAAASVAASQLGLAPSDAVRLQQSARTELQRDQALWGRDYATAVSESASPGRVAGIPRALRVRR